MSPKKPDKPPGKPEGEALVEAEGRPPHKVRVPTIRRIKAKVVK
jgi:hypothetical protein